MNDLDRELARARAAAILASPAVQMNRLATALDRLLECRPELRGRDTHDLRTVIADLAVAIEYLERRVERLEGRR